MLPLSFSAFSMWTQKTGKKIETSKKRRKTKWGKDPALKIRQRYKIRSWQFDIKNFENHEKNLEGKEFMKILD